MKLTARYAEAFAYAHELHIEQLRKGTEIPYVSHLMSVSALALEHGADEDTAIAALLHDAVEDQGGEETLEEIRRRFGERVAATVDGCTDAYVQPKPPWRERKEAYLAHLAEATPECVLVSACDKLHNARTILEGVRAQGDAQWEIFKGGKDGSLWYYRGIVEGIRGRAPAGLVEELDRVVTALEAS